jgi:hypothetical protein
MRVLRLTTVWIALLALIACSRVPQGITEIPARHESATLHNTTPVSAKAARALSALKTPPVDSLPELPFGDQRVRVASVAQTITIDGNNSFAAGGGALNLGNTKLLSGTPGTTSWAIYRVPSLPGAAQLQQLNVVVSNGAFTGSAPGYWIGLANFADNTWKVLNRTQDDYQALLSGSDFISGAGNLYVFVLVVEAQSVVIDNVALTYDIDNDNGWTEVELESGADNGWTPAVAVDTYGSPWIVWTNHATGLARWAWGNRTLDLSNPAAWVIETVDSAPVGKTQYTDLTIDPATDFPVASLNYVEQSADAQNSQAGMSVFVIGPQSQQMWLNFSFGKMDGAKDTSIDFDPVSGFFGMATCASNANSPGLDFDMYVRYIDLGDLANPGDNMVKVSSGFGEDMLYPHLRFNPEQQVTRVMARGSELLVNEVHPSSDTPSWFQFNEVTDPGSFGSLAYNQTATGPRFGTTYSKTVGNAHTLFYTPYADEGDEPESEIVDSIPSVGLGEWLGGTSQLAYTWDGRPLIAYTVKDANGAVTVKLAQRGAQWTSETVSTDMSEAGATPQAIQVDLAVEPAEYFSGFERTNYAWVVWNDLAGSLGSVRAAFKAID